MSAKPNSQEGSRHKSREMALQLLFQSEFLPSSSRRDGDDIIERFVGSFTIEPGVASYGKQIYLGVLLNAQKIDEKIESASQNWKLARMAAVDRAILRICTFEMLFLQPSLPPEIAIDEAVEMAKKYGGTETPSFVNGILDQIAVKSRLRN